ncbi:MAG: ribosome biogenesis GTP-binding protein YsxC [Chlamydiales bacterium]|nr:ribosome biogenesis GTP-binding protein YsxC [Chlamydiales bacterium]
MGKSSLINHLLKRKELAFVSATPGKTQTLNFFVIDERLCFVDLPGYGYAKAADALKAKWAEAIQNYLVERPALKSILFLLDSRRLPNEEDCGFIEWVSRRGLPFLLIFTKTDKLSDTEKEEHIEKSLAILQVGKPPLHFLCYSIKNGRSRIELIEKINALLRQ